MISASDHVWITLEQQHLAFSEALAVKRQANAETLDLHGDNNAPNDHDTALRYHRTGAAGETAAYVAFKAAGHPIKWNTMVRELPDFDRWIDVKTRSSSDGDLIVGKNSPPEWCYVLARSHNLPRVCLVGWCWGYEAKKVKLRDAYGNGRPAHFIEDTNPILKPMSALARLRETRHPGFVGKDAEGHLAHYCHCGAWGSHGANVELLKGRTGTWLCAGHHEQEQQRLHALEGTN